MIIRRELDDLSLTDLAVSDSLVFGGVEWLVEEVIAVMADGREVVNLRLVRADTATANISRAAEHSLHDLRERVHGGIIEGFSAFDDAASQAEQSLRDRVESATRFTESIPEEWPDARS